MLEVHSEDRVSFPQGEKLDWYDALDRMDMLLYIKLFGIWHILVNAIIFGVLYVNGLGIYYGLWALLLVLTSTVSYIKIITHHNDDSYFNNDKDIRTYNMIKSWLYIPFILIFLYVRGL